MEGRAVDTIGPFLNIVARVCFTTQIDEYLGQNGFLHYHHPFTSPYLLAKNSVQLVNSPYHAHPHPFCARGKGGRQRRLRQ